MAPTDGHGSNSTAPDLAVLAYAAPVMMALTLLRGYAMAVRICRW